MHGDTFWLCLQPSSDQLVVQAGLMMAVSTAETCRHALTKI